jgi:hypothetical protein
MLTFILRPLIRYTINQNIQKTFTYLKDKLDYLSSEPENYAQMVSLRSIAILLDAPNEIVKGYNDLCNRRYVKCLKRLYGLSNP